jgi:hypothetical protein
VGAAASKPPKTAPQQAAPQSAAAPSPQTAKSDGQPKVSLWNNDDYDDAVPDERTATFAAAGSANRAPGSFPASAKQSVPDESHDEYDGEEETDDEPQREPRSTRWLVGALLAAVLVIGLIFAVTNLGGLFKPSTPEAVKTSQQPKSAPAPSTTPSASPSAPAVPPAIESVTRQGNFDFAATYDGDLVKTFDGNAASYWSDMEFATDTWGGFANEGVPLVVKLKAPAQISSVALSQLGGSGGSISVFTNDRPSLDGAKPVGNNSFTSPELTMPLQEPVTAQYVIVTIKTLPKLAAPKTRYGYGLRLAEIKVH